MSLELTRNHSEVTRTGPDQNGHDSAQCKFCSFLLTRKWTGWSISVDVVRKLEVECPACAVFNKFIGPHIRDEAKLTVYHRSYDEAKIFFIKSALHRIEKVELDPTELRIESGHQAPWKIASINPPAICNAQRAASLIRDWIKVCHTEHKECQQSYEAPELPTRVLEIFAIDKVRVSVPEPGTRAEYISLSHCWGGGSALKTTNATYRQFLKEIPWRGLPKTFQDAVHLTWFLGVRFIWIDSLCIIQGNTDDWRTEGSKMATIYSNSYITLSASTADNASVGLYNPMPYISTRHQDLTEYNMYGVPCPDSDHGDWILFQRAWSSTRIPRWAKERLDFKTKGSDTGLSTAERWHDMVQPYSSCDLTYDKDKLPAIQGLAKTMENLLGDYYAGLWGSNFIADLLWYTEEPSSRYDTYIAPTWSWASICGGVRYLATHGERLAQVVSVHTTPAGIDPTGEIANGTLVLRGFCISAITEKSSLKFLVGHRSDIILGKEPLRHEYWHPDSQDYSDAHVTEITMMFIGKGGHAQDPYFDMLAFKGKTDRNDVYERVGFAYVYGEYWFPAFREYAIEKTIAVV